MCVPRGRSRFFGGSSGDIGPPSKILPNFDFTERRPPMRKITDEERMMGTRAAAIANHERTIKRKKMKEDLSILLTLAISEGRAVPPEELQNLAEANGKNITVQTAIDVAIVQRAMMGDVAAAQFIRDTVGEKPTDKVELDSSLSIESWAKKHKVKL